MKVKKEVSSRSGDQLCTHCFAALQIVVWSCLSFPYYDLYSDLRSNINSQAANPLLGTGKQTVEITIGSFQRNLKNRRYFLFLSFAGEREGEREARGNGIRTRKNNVQPVTRDSHSAVASAFLKEPKNCACSSGYFRRGDFMRSCWRNKLTFSYTV